MTESDLKDLIDRVQHWPETAQDELVALANQIEKELQGNAYFATQDELRIVDAAIASLDDGASASEAEVAAAFAN